MKKALVLALMLLTGCAAAPNHAVLNSTTTVLSTKSAATQDIQKLLEDVQTDANGNQTYNYAIDQDPEKAAVKGLYRLQPVLGSRVQSFTTTRKIKKDTSRGRYYHVTFKANLSNGQSKNLTVDTLREFYGDDFEDSGLYKAVDAQLR